MTRVRVAAALAALLTALLLQATVVGPLSMPVPVSLPALLVAAIALVDGPGAGMAFGFAIGLIADLGSEHPAGILALCWLGVGLVCGVVARPHSALLRDVLVAAMACGAASVLATALIDVVGAGGGAVEDAVRRGILATIVDVVLALAVVVPVRMYLRSDPLRAPVLLGTQR